MCDSLVFLVPHRLSMYNAELPPSIAETRMSSNLGNSSLVYAAIWRLSPKLSYSVLRQQLNSVD